jgi:uncharacterized membrane protein
MFFLRILTVLAGITILAGGILLIVQSGHAPTDFRVFAGQPDALKVVSLIGIGAFHGAPLAIIQLGILLLIVTPVLRVFFVGIGFAVEKDWMYVVVAGIVLAVLLESLVKPKL